MGAEYTIREATAADVELAVRFRSYMTGGVPQGTVENYEARVRALYEAGYAEGSIVHYFAESPAGEPIASAGALLKSDFPYCLFAPGYYGWIIDVYTRPGWRGRGIAGALLAKANEWLKRKGAYESRLLACGEKPRALYARHGYRSTWEMSLNMNPAVLTFNELIDRQEHTSNEENQK